MKICDHEFTRDQAILTAEGSLLCMEAAAMFGAPTWLQDQAFKAEKPRSNAVARIAGLGIGATGLHVLAAGRTDDRTMQRRAAKICAGKAAVVAGMAASQLAGKEPERVMDQNKLIGVAAYAATTAAVMAWRGWKKDDD